MYITVTDLTTYKPGLSFSGGAYAFSETVEVPEEGVVLRGRHDTSADFGYYCPLCGRFEQRLEEHRERWHDAPIFEPSKSTIEAAGLIVDNDEDSVSKALSEKWDAIIEVEITDQPTAPLYWTEDGWDILESK